jgi:hypothetical protein
MCLETPSNMWSCIQRVDSSCSTTIISKESYTAWLATSYWYRRYFVGHGTTVTACALHSTRLSVSMGTFSTLMYTMHESVLASSPEHRTHTLSLTLSLSLYVCCFWWWYFLIIFLVCWHCFVLFACLLFPFRPCKFCRNSQRVGPCDHLDGGGEP